MRKPHLSHNAAHSNDGAFRCSTGHQSLSDSLCHQERTLMENGLFSHAFRGFIRWLTKVWLNIYWYFIYSGSCLLPVLLYMPTFRLTWMTLSNSSSSMLSKKSSCVMPAAFTHTKGGWKKWACRGEFRQKALSWGWSVHVGCCIHLDDTPVCLWEASWRCLWKTRLPQPPCDPALWCCSASSQGSCWPTPHSCQLRPPRHPPMQSVGTQHVQSRCLLLGGTRTLEESRGEPAAAACLLSSWVSVASLIKNIYLRPNASIFHVLTMWVMLLVLAVVKVIQRVSL